MPTQLKDVLDKSRLEAAKLYIREEVTPKLNHGRRVSQPVLSNDSMSIPFSDRHTKWVKVKTPDHKKAVQKANPGKKERAKMKGIAKHSIIASNFAEPLCNVPKSSGSMFSRVALAKDMSPFSVAHAPARGAGQGKERPDKGRTNKQSKRFGLK